MNASDTLISILDNHAKTHPDKLAYTFLAENGKTTLTNYELWKKVTALAARLLIKVKTESRAILLLPPGLDYIVAFLGCLRAGVIVVPAYPLRNNRHMQRLLAVIHDARAEVVITTSAFAHQYPLANILTLEIDNMFSQAYSESLPEITQNQLAFLQYTSGSTGSPKGVMISHGNIIANANLIDSLLAGNCKTVCSWLPPFHDMGLIGAILYPLYKNIHSILMAPTTFLKRPFLWLKAISDYKADASPAPNFAYEMCVNRVTETEKKELDLSHWLVALNGAEPVNAQTLIKFSTAFASCGFRAGSCYPAYGMAEATLMVSGKKPGDSTVVLEVDKQALQTRHHLVLDTRGEKVNVVSCGYTAASHEIKIINPKTKKLLPAYKIGEIVVAGPSITQGYWGKPTLTQKIFALQLPHSNKRFLRTGDLGFTDEKGQLFITGRLKDLIIIQGQNIYPQDIEQAVTESHPALIEHGSAAFLVDFNGEPELIVVQEVHRSAKNFEVIFTAILKRCAEDFAILPTQITLIQQATLPKTSSGKVQRNACRNALLKGDLKVVKEWKQVPKKTTTVTQLMVASHELQSWMQQWFAERLNLTIQQLDTKTNFAYYGVDAGIAVQFCVALEKRLNRSINPSLLWSYSSIEELTEYLLTNCTSSQAEGVNQKSILKQNFEPIAIVGMSCRLPGGIKTPEQFWKFLQAGKNGITDIPDKRWDIEQYYNFSSVAADKMLNRKGGFIDDAEWFDVSSLSISRRDLAAMEPQYQLLLQLIGEALESADIAPFTINNSDTTLFVGISSKDSYPHLVSDSLHQSVNGYHKLGNLHRAAVGKIAYLLGTQGPALAIDTACSSSLVAVLNACQSLQDDICNLAIVGGVNTLLEPPLNLHIPNIDMLSLQGKCRVFDKEADGYVRSEGCGVLILKRLRDATRQGDKIMAVIKSGVINSDGRRYEDARFDSKVQKELLSKALSLAGLSADDLGYIEAHGTGILLADSTEFDALRQVFATGKRQNPLYIGSVKSNLGHLEAAAGMAGLIKTILMLQYRQIPPNLHFKTVNPFIELNTIPAKIPIQLEPWKAPGTNIRYAGISAFGFTGINVHLILTEIP